MPEPRRLLLSVDNSDASEAAVKWVMANLYQEGDEVHLVHVIPRLQLAATYGAPPVDFLPFQDPTAYEQMIKTAEDFIAKRALTHIGGISPQPVVHIVKYEIDTDSIGNVVCKKAEELEAAVTVLARHSKSRLQEFFLGSVSNFCVHHCKRPVLVHSG
ncbi:adenine nucleotide alpha hydrolase [Chlorella sorokiniana]|uniref:Adenine nucleotide alpha hydrolase n=1 Tax=Chlorella sorokiniana TaxID=3076 RepID=A0A2P6THE9_CHLSO|nr:adenine nucleotide alpha hydrolase [Chlorella sorokiniana]|eukprot:PRW33715.1 adenine nucleotide alpha hydrolase [Chlorella sorokiniana]